MTVAFSGLVLAACGMGEMAGGPSDIATPGSRQLNWFAFLDGADIRRACGPGSGDQARMVFNGRYLDQVRAYELRQQGGAPVLETHVFSPLQVNRPFDVETLGEVMRGRPTTERLGRAGVDTLWAALAESGAFAPPPKGLWLDSEDFYWVVSGCRAGAGFFHAWVHPSPGFAGLTFPEVIRRYEQSDIAWPSVDMPRDLWRQSDIREGERPHFRLEVGRDGIRR
ncbi:MAG: hypothetical protein VR70_13685 [Rhodospirillaceae bacterium BRH_c57]|nr:MAG: hypothetical protein VR70_13685 [Rhodospirillaceae bacterium BRH_c57]